MESTADNDAIKEMLQQWAGEDTEIVFEKLRKLQAIEKVYRGKTSTDRIHDVPKSYGKFAGLIFVKNVTCYVSAIPPLGLLKSSFTPNFPE